MKVHGTKSETVMFDIADRELLNYAVQLIEHRSGLKDRWIEDGWVCESERDWRHGSVGTDKVRAASEEDRKNYALLRSLREFQATLK